ncbi:MAG: bifunctional folylpolyglutamate synthase/dihydrofolate synthase [Dysgonamonadaceae bacterium]|jgi:dihydrofolate synthase/folylpolyglutamate synthase|nr:bifunctional folylpolyglutamate synthase/dihydrofolate synthase [Dysgonamonadaceae bacterium]
MTYPETVAYLYHIAPLFQHVGSAAYKEGLDNMLALDLRLQHPHRSYRTIHVGGTNGKGSVSHLLAAVLQCSGYRVGLYTSPHLQDFRERIRMNGQMIPETFVTDFTQRHRPFIEHHHPSFFEISTGMAFAYFAAENADVAVIEVGLGGRLDSTNIITPALSVITNISLDHMNLLGDTPEKIAVEKAGIIKHNVPALIGEASGNTSPVFTRKAQEVHTRILFAEDQPAIQSARLQENGKWRFQTQQYPDLEIGLGGWIQQKNANTVLCALKELENTFTIPREAVYRGFARVVELTGLQGRWQVTSLAPKTILDTAHNEAGIQQAIHQLQHEKYDHLHIIIGMMRDKDLSTILKLLPRHARYYFTKAQIPRALPENELKEKAATAGLTGNAHPTIADAIAAARQAASPEDVIFIGGSNFVVGESLGICLPSTTPAK